MYRVYGRHVMYHFYVPCTLLVACCRQPVHAGLYAKPSQGLLACLMAILSRSMECSLDTQCF